MRSRIPMRLAAAWLALAPTLALAQFGPAPVRSPEVDQDGRVTFRFRAPNAREVALSRDGAPRAAMAKDDRGVWSLTTDPLPPDLYPYSFVVDGATLADPANPRVKPIVMGGSQSLAHVPGPKSLSWEEGDVPRGAIHRHFYTSKIAGEGREYYVYTPPGYDPAGAAEYPVLYLLHGITDDASAWTNAGRAHVILDNLIAREEAVPMLVVMPLGYPFPNPAEDLFKLFREKDAQRTSLEQMAATIVDELIPRVEADYRAAKGRDRRAVAGLSMGGAQALVAGLNRPETFGWVASFSGGFVMYGDDYAGLFPALAGAEAPAFRLVWLACGTDDFLIQSHRKFEGWLKGEGLAFESKETPGAHTWMVWRRYLTELAPRLFRDAGPEADRRP